MEWREEEASKQRWDQATWKNKVSGFAVLAFSSEAERNDALAVLALRLDRPDVTCGPPRSWRSQPLHGIQLSASLGASGRTCRVKDNLMLWNAPMACTVHSSP